jgi:hypothetical protein
VGADVIDFPASPSVGQIFAAAGASWRWDGTKWVAYGGGSSGDVGRNLLHNPLFQVQQRGLGPWGLGMTADRWNLQGSTTGGSVSAQINAMTASIAAAFNDEYAKFNYAITSTAGTGANDQVALQQNIEDLRRLSGKTVTVSFWAWCNSGTPKIGIELAQVFGSGGSPSAFVSVPGGAITISAAATRYSVTIAVPSVSGKTFGTTAGSDYTGLFFWVSAGSSNAARASNIGLQSGTFVFWGAQLEIGSTATPLEKPDPQQDLAKCQRFYAQGNVNFAMQGVAGQNFANTITLPVWMRANPTITFGSPALTNCTGLAIVQPNSGQMTVYALTTATGQTQINSNYTASADL